MIKCQVHLFEFCRHFLLGEGGLPCHFFIIRTYLFLDMKNRSLCQWNDQRLIISSQLCIHFQRSLYRQHVVICLWIFDITNIRNLRHKRHLYPPHITCKDFDVYRSRYLHLLMLDYCNLFFI